MDPRSREATPQAAIYASAEFINFRTSQLAVASASSQFTRSTSNSPQMSRNNTPRSHPRDIYSDQDVNSPSNSSSSSSKNPKTPRPPVKDLIERLSTHRVNTLTELCRIERIAASCQDLDDAKAFQGPMTAAWIHYVTSNQLLSELRGLTPRYPFSADLAKEAHLRVRCDPNSNRSWNLAWLCLVCMQDEAIIHTHAVLEANRKEMWGDVKPSKQSKDQLTAEFEKEWSAAIEMMLRHWATPPTWY